MRLLIISDTHGELEKLKELSNQYKDYTKIHLGDRGFDKSELDSLGFIYVDGNCDTQDNKDKLLEIDDFKIFITHGDKYSVKYSLDKLYFKALSLGAHYVFYGHTHIQRIIEANGIKFINPGSLLNDNYCVIDDEIKMF